MLMLSFSLLYSRIVKRTVCFGLPMAVSVEPINGCNLFCTECPTGVGNLTRPKGCISLASYKKIIAQVKEKSVMVNLYFQGEPFLHSGLIELIQYSKQQKLIVSTSTNGHFINKDTAMDIVRSGLDEIYVSLDGVDQKTYEKYRSGGRISSVIKSIENLVSAKKKCNSDFPIIRTQMLVFSYNEHQVQLFKDLSCRLGADVADIKTAQIYNVNQKSHLVPRSAVYSRYVRGVDGKYEVKGKVKNSCWKHWISCVVTWDGNLVPCCFDKNAFYVFGNLLHSELKEIWQCEKYNSFRKQILIRQERVEICRNCPLSRG